MPRFTLFMIRQGFEISPRYSIVDGVVIENNKSIFNNPVYSKKEYAIESAIVKRGLKPVLVEQARSPELVYFRNNEKHDPWWKDFWQKSDHFQFRPETF